MLMAEMCPKDNIGLGHPASCCNSSCCCCRSVRRGHKSFIL